MVLSGFRDGLFAGKGVLVTGAARGIGLSTAEAFAALGARVALIDRDGDEVREAARKLGSAHLALPLDISDYDAVARAAARVAQEVGALHVVVNNAGIFERSPVTEERTVESWRRIFSVNADGPFHVVHAFLGALRESRGSIVNLASTRAYTAAAHAPAYTASKGAVVALTKALAVELAPHGIRVNGVAPSDVRTRMTAGGGSDAAIQAGLYERTPLGRPAEPEEIAALIVFLASPLASFMTGAVVPIDGGFLAT
ncbi:MAG: SDR family NAD(P)-dependent oxidoreductase [Alphaproteobacteria bacterium]